MPANCMWQKALGHSAINSWLYVQSTSHVHSCRMSTLLREMERKDIRKALPQKCLLTMVSQRKRQRSELGCGLWGERGLSVLRAQIRYETISSASMKLPVNVALGGEALANVSHPCSGCSGDSGWCGSDASYPHWFPVHCAFFVFFLAQISKC